MIEDGVFPFSDTMNGYPSGEEAIALKTLACPTCGAAPLDVCRYDSMMVVREDLALFSLTCPSCGAKISTLHGIPAALRDEVRFAAIEIGAGGIK